MDKHKIIIEVIGGDSYHQSKNVLCNKKKFNKSTLKQYLFYHIFYILFKKIVFFTKHSALFSVKKKKYFGSIIIFILLQTFVSTITDYYEQKTIVHFRISGEKFSKYFI